MGDRALIPISPSEIPPAQNITSTLQEVFRHIYFNETVIHAKLRNSSSTYTTHSLPEKLATSSKQRDGTRKSTIQGVTQVEETNTNKTRLH